MSSKNILLITSNFSPEPSGVALYTTDLAKTLSHSGIQVTVITGQPYYPWWKKASQNEVRLHDERFLADFQLHIYRVQHFVPTISTLFSRLGLELSFFISFMNIIRQKPLSEHDLIVAYLPAVASGAFARFLAKKLKIPLVLVVQDLSGNGVTESGLTRGLSIQRIANFFEMFIIRSASSVVAISDEMKVYLQDVGISPTRIELIQNYAIKDFPVIDRKIARKKLGWNTEDFIVLHAGNMGMKQNLEEVVTTARLLDSASKVKIYLVGHGNQESRLQSLSSNATNLSLYPMIAEEDYPLMLCAADILLVSERSSQITMSLPSKLTGYLLSKRPILAYVPSKGSTANFLRGKATIIECGSPVLLAKTISDIKDGVLSTKEQIQNGFDFASLKLNADIGRNRYYKLISKYLNED